MKDVYVYEKYRIDPTEDQKAKIDNLLEYAKEIWKAIVDLQESTRKRELISLYHLHGYLYSSGYRNRIPNRDMEGSIVRYVYFKFSDSWKRYLAGKINKPGIQATKHRHSFTIQYNDNYILKPDSIVFPYLGEISVFNYNIPETYMYMIFSKDVANRYFIIICRKKKVDDNTSATGKIGIDLGIKDFCICSDGTKSNFPESLYKVEQRILQYKKQLKKKQKGSKGYEDLRCRMNKALARGNDIKRDYLHKLSTKLVKENKVICMESLDINQLIRKNRHSHTINRLGWGIFTQMLEYKCKWTGTKLIKVSKFYPSTQICSKCGHKNLAIANNTAIRSWECPICHTKHDRDINAAQNILTRGLDSLECFEDYAYM